MKSFSYDSMGTKWEIKIWDEIEDVKFSSIKEEIIKQSNLFDNTYSRFKENSLVTELSKKKGIFKVEEHFTNILNLYKKFFELTDGKITPCIGNTIEDIGYNAEYSLKPKSIIRMTPNLMKDVEIIDKNTINLKNYILFDFGALGKGYFVEKVANFLKSHELNHFLVDGSGDVYYEGPEAYKMGLEDPEDATKAIGVYEMKKGSMCSSAVNRRAWGEYNHYIDPDSLKSPKSILATFVVCESTALADAIASALFFVAPERILKEFEFEYLVINEKRQTKVSASFQEIIFIS